VFWLAVRFLKAADLAIVSSFLGRSTAVGVGHRPICAINGIPPPSVKVCPGPDFSPSDALGVDHIPASRDRFRPWVECTSKPGRRPSCALGVAQAPTISLSGLVFRSSVAGLA
jgi:hypothetical protein